MLRYVCCNLEYESGLLPTAANDSLQLVTSDGYLPGKSHDHDSAVAYRSNINQEQWSSPTRYGTMARKLDWSSSSHWTA